MLLDAKGRVKLADFGLARTVPMAGQPPMTPRTGSWRWMAPEVIAGKDYNEKVGIVCSILFGQLYPFRFFVF